LFLKSEPALILASSSAYRRQLLTRLGVEFSVASADIDEYRGEAEPPVAMAARLARQKAQHIARAHPGAWIIGADQIAVLDGEVIGKPGTLPRCIEQLQHASGRRVQFLTAVALTRADKSAGSPLHEFVDSTWVKFRELDSSTVHRYVHREMPLDCAGGFKCEGLGIALFDSIESADPTALIGLPLIGVAKLLNQVGFQVP
jgi:septum formation protein